MLGELKVKLCNVGVPVLLCGSEFPASMCLIMLDSISVEAYETSVESCVGNDSDDRRLALNISLLSGRSRRMVYGFSFPGLSPISGEVGIFVKSVTLL